MLGNLPKRPQGKPSEQERIYSSSMSAVKSEIINNNYHKIEYHIIKVASGGEYSTLKNEVEIKDLWKFVVIRLMDLL